jgi:hypothetical protein
MLPSQDQEVGHRKLKIGCEAQHDAAGRADGIAGEEASEINDIDYVGEILSVDLKAHFQAFRFVYIGTGGSEPWSLQPGRRDRSPLDAVHRYCSVQRETERSRRRARQVFPRTRRAVSHRDAPKQQVTRRFIMRVICASAGAYTDARLTGLASMVIRKHVLSNTTGVAEASATSILAGRRAASPARKGHCANVAI